MKVKAGTDSIRIDDWFELKSATWRTKRGSYHIVQPCNWVDLLAFRKKNSKAQGLPSFCSFAANRLEFYPATDAEGEFRVVYTILKQI